MLVDQQLRKTVAFLVVRYQDEYGVVQTAPIGTVFFCSVDVPGGEDEGLHSVYGVTAAHVLRMARSRHGDDIAIRFNLIEGGYRDYWATQDMWIESTSSDVAVIPMFSEFAELDFHYVGIEDFATADEAEDLGIAEGDEVFFVGLFALRPGLDRNIPLFRFGTVAAVPEEKITIKLDDLTTLDVDAYLVETRSWGGQSGSPAWVYFAPLRDFAKVQAMAANEPIPSPPEEATVKIRPQKVLGLLQGHYTLKTEGGEDVNAGIAIVVPSQEIIDTLTREELVAYRKKSLENYRKKQQPIAVPEPDAVPKERENDKTREEFLQDLHRVTRRSDESGRSGQQQS